MDVVRRLGDANRRAGHFENAFKNYEDALKISKGSNDIITITLSQGNGYFSLKQYDKAIVCYRKALDINNNDSDVWNNLAHVLSIVNRTGDAKHAIDIALKKIDKMRDLKQENVASYYHPKGIIDFQLGDQKESICSFKKANNMLRSYFYSTPVISI
ncbi:tetratricopeptide repeat protein [Candidatus Nitrosocosmicus sp. T]